MPRVLDLFCGAGGASMGWHRAGYDVTGVDITPHPSYPFTFIQADARETLADVEFLASFDVLTGGPPCQALTRSRHLREAQGGKLRENGQNLIPETRAGFLAAGRPYVIENVDDALPHLENPVRLCGSAFGLKVRRHRWFESNVFLFGQECDHRAQGRPVGIYHVLGDNVPNGGTTATSIEEAREAMGIDWMRWKSDAQEWDDLKESIPPAYTEYVAGQVLEALACLD